MEKERGIIITNVDKQKQCDIHVVSSRFYKIVDKHGIEMPDHYSGRRRNYREAKKMVDGLNKNGEHKPYKMIEV
tara:strand:- start:862 stop:1083 length:222 start_codon:yes stop_codon:yes gene_type:complete